MDSGWIASHQLPSKFWWHALKRATYVANHIPIKINNIMTTLHKLTYRKKIDLRTLLPIFSVCYIHRIIDSQQQKCQHTTP